MSLSIQNNEIALLVIDMQNDFLVDSAPIKCVGGIDVIEPILKLKKKLKKMKVPIIYTQEAHRREKVDFGLELEFGEPEHCLEGSQGVEFVDSLQPQDGEYLIKKRRYSAFFATDLDILLRGLGVNKLILVGVATDVCVRATAQDAHQHNYEVFVPKECVAGTSKEAHISALSNISYIFGHVLPLNKLLKKIVAEPVGVN